MFRDEIELQVIDKRFFARNNANDMWAITALFCDFYSLLMLMQVSKSLNAIAKSEHVWKKRLLIHRHEMELKDSPISSYTRLTKELKFELSNRRKSDSKKAAREMKFMIAFAEGDQDAIRKLNFSHEDAPDLYDRRSHAFFRAVRNQHQNILDVCYQTTVMPFYQKRKWFSKSAELDFSKTDINGWDILSHAVLFGQSTQEIEKILKQLESLLRFPIYTYRGPPVTLNFDTPALHIAAWVENVELTQFFLTYSQTRSSPKLHFDPNVTGAYRSWPIDSSDRWYLRHNGGTALHIAVQRGHVFLAAMLLHHEADATQLTADELAPAAFAVERDFSDMMDLFLERMSPLHQAIGPRKEVPLLYAVRRGSERMVRQIAGSSCIDFNAVNEVGESALHVAVVKKRFNLARMLILEYRVDSSILTHKGLTVLHYLSYGDKSPEYVRNACWLIETVDIQIVDKGAFYGGWRGQTPLYLAIINDNVMLVTALLLRGADADSNFLHDNMFEIATLPEIKFLIIEAQLKAYIKKLMPKEDEVKADQRLFSVSPLLKTAVTILNALLEKQSVESVVKADNPVFQEDPALERMYERAVSMSIISRNESIFTSCLTL